MHTWDCRERHSLKAPTKVLRVLLDVHSCGPDNICIPDPGDGGVRGGSDGPMPGPDAARAVDSDQDGISDEIDNCPQLANDDQVDTDSDGLGDGCDAEPNQANYGLRGEITISSARGVTTENDLRGRAQATSKTSEDGTYFLTGGLLQ